MEMARNDPDAAREERSDRGRESKRDHGAEDECGDVDGLTHEPAEPAPHDERDKQCDDDGVDHHRR